MPDSFGKRNREKIKAEKAEARDARRIARSQRRKGILPVPDRGEIEAREETEVATDAVDEVVTDVTEG
jgi:hypothetical protein